MVMRERRGQRAGRRIMALLCLGVLLTTAAQAQVTVRLPDTTAVRGTTLILPVSLQGVSGARLVSTEVFLRYDPARLAFGGTRFDGRLLANWLVNTAGSLEGLHSYLDSSRVTAAGSETLKVVGATVQDTLTADGVLFAVQFQVADQRDAGAIPVILEHVLLNNGAPVAVAVSGSIRPTGTNGAIEGRPELLVRNQALQVTVVDADEDRTAGTDAVQVTVTNRGQTESFTATESATPGSFSGSISVVFSQGSTASGDGQVQVRQGDQVKVCYEDRLDATGYTISRCATSVVDVGTLGAVAGSVAAQAGDSVRVRVTDVDLNGDPATRDTVSAVLANRRTGETARVLLQETGVTTGVLFGYGLTRYGAGAGSPLDGEVNVQRGDTLLVTYEDVASGTGAPQSLRDTCMVVDPWGDASGNGVMGGLDAAMILQHSVGAIVLAGVDSLSANVDSLAPLGPIDSYDASLVLRRRVGLIDRFPVQLRGAAIHPQPESGAAVPKEAVAARRVALVQRADHLVVALDERAGILAGELLLRGFTGRVTMAPELADYLLSWRRTPAGTRVAFAGVCDVVGPGALVRLLPAPGDQVELAGASFNGGSIPGLTSSDQTRLPEGFGLEPNAPNPFNPETLIRYSLPQDGPVRLAILNAAGQCLRLLEQGRRTAGSHAVRWDGRDEQGAVVASGIYFTELTAGELRAVSRMVLVK